MKLDNLASLGSKQGRYKGIQAQTEQEAMYALRINYNFLHFHVQTANILSSPNSAKRTKSELQRTKKKSISDRFPSLQV